MLQSFLFKGLIGSSPGLGTITERYCYLEVLSSYHCMKHFTAVARKKKKKKVWEFPGTSQGSYKKPLIIFQLKLPLWIGNEPQNQKEERYCFQLLVRVAISFHLQLETTWHNTAQEWQRVCSPLSAPHRGTVLMPCISQAEISVTPLKEVASCFPANKTPWFCLLSCFLASVYPLI